MYRNNFNLGDENMDITLIFKVAGVGILISVLNMILTKSIEVTGHHLQLLQV